MFYKILNILENKYEHKWFIKEMKFDIVERLGCQGHLLNYNNASYFSLFPTSLIYSWF